MLEWIINDPFVPFATESEGSQSTLSSDALNLFIPIAVLFAPTSLRYTEIHSIVRVWLRKICSSCLLIVLPGPALVLHNNVLQTILCISVIIIFFAFSSWLH